MKNRREKSSECARAADAIEDFGDGRVGRVRWMFLRRHVKDCPECGTYFSRMSTVVEALAELQGVQAPEDFARLVMQRLVAGLAAARPEPREARHGRRNLLWALAAGVGVAMAVGLAIVWWALGWETAEKLVTAGSA
ncbi:MAG: hypothetical protein ACYC99_05770 [Candidatus Geothermincolia bacterium]